MTAISKVDITYLEIDESSDGQRIDNFLFKTLKGIPKTHIYKIIRSGEVRVNSRRISASYRLKMRERVRIPPVRTLASKGEKRPVKNHLALDDKILFEDEHLLIIDKPPGLAVHGGSGISQGVIENIRAAKTSSFLELAHRLDKETSGVLILAKKRASLLSLHTQFRDGAVHKTYFAVVSGAWEFSNKVADFRLLRTVRKNGERFVIVASSGQEARTEFSLDRKNKNFAMLKVDMLTGRTHQIRVHLAHLGFPVAGDQKYGNSELNKLIEKTGVKRMMLHAKSITFAHPKTGKKCHISTELPFSYNQLLGNNV